MSPFFFKRVLRAPAKQIGVLLVTLVLSGLLCFLADYRERQAQKRTETIDSAEVLCVVTNINGTQSTHLRMGYGGMQAVTREDYYRLPQYVKDIRASKEFVASLTYIGLDETLLAVTSPKGLMQLDPDMGGKVTLLYDDFYTSQEMWIVVSEDVYRSMNGDTVVFGKIFDPMLNRDETDERGSGTVEFTVAGYYAGPGEETYIPFETGMQILDSITGSRSLDSLAFVAKDNHTLDALRDAASDVFGTVMPDAATGPYRFALTVHDEDLRMTVAALDSNIRRTDWLIPITLALALAAGFLMGFIATRNESNTYALMRSVGMTKRKLLLAALLEQLLLPLLACAVMGAVFRASLGAFAVFLLYALGCTVAVLRAVSVSPTKLLREQE